MFLDYAELQAQKQRAMKMMDWISRIDAFLRFNQYDILQDAGRVKAEVAKKIAEREYEKFSKKQDQEYESDFDKFVKRVREGDPLPIEDESEKKRITPFDKDLKGLLNVPPEKDL